MLDHPSIYNEWLQLTVSIAVSLLNTKNGSVKRPTDEGSDKANQ